MFKATFLPSRSIISSQAAPRDTAGRLSGRARPGEREPVRLRQCHVVDYRRLGLLSAREARLYHCGLGDLRGPHRRHPSPGGFPCTVQHFRQARPHRLHRDRGRAGGSCAAFPQGERRALSQVTCCLGEPLLLARDGVLVRLLSR